MHRRVRTRPAALAVAAVLLGLPIASGPVHGAAAAMVLGWGASFYGQLGDGTTAGKAYPSLSGLGAGGRPVAVSAGGSYSLALQADGTVLAAGSDVHGRLGDGGANADVSTPVMVQGLGPGSGVVAVSANHGNSLALRSDGSVLAWGSDLHGQLGDGGTPEPDNAYAVVTDRSTPVAVSGLGAGSGVVAVAAGANHALALRADGAVMAWGGDHSGQLGDGAAIVHQPTPVPVSGLGAGSGVVAIAANSSYSLALRSDGAVLAWGADYAGVLGNGTTDAPQFTPVPSGLGAGSGVVAISGGDAHVLALRSDGAVLAWGADRSGQLGDGGANANQSSPVAVSGLGTGSGVVAVDAGADHNLALRSDGSVMAWGDDGGGQLGHGCARTNQPTPVAVSGLGPGSGVTSVSAGAFSLAIRSGSTTTPPTPIAVPPGAPARAQGFGLNNAGQLGDGTTIDRPAPPGAGALLGTREVSAGYYHSLARRDDGTAWAWGWNAVGQLGNGTTVDRAAPTQVAGLTAICGVASGAMHSLALRSDGTVWAWGWNAVGQLGDGTNLDRRVPVRVPGLNNVIAVSAGAYHSLALLGDGTVRAWGWNAYGQLGNGGTANSHVPVAVPSLGGIESLSAGGFHNLAAGWNGTVRAWGWNRYGQLGIASSAEMVPSPVMIPSLGPLSVSSVAAGWLHSLAVVASPSWAAGSGYVAGWGWNGVGQLGDGTTTDRRSPFRVEGLNLVRKVAAGHYHSLALDTEGSVASWGWNAFGQLGDGTTTDRHRPEARPLAAGALQVSGGAGHTLVTVR